jgi:hypothetical protein
LVHAGEGHPAVPARSGAARLGWFLRHLAEMTVVMVAGMVAGAVGFFLVAGLSPEEAFLRVPVLFCLVIAAGSALPMVAWMRHRGHDWGSCREMAAAMALPLAPIFAVLAGRHPRDGVLRAVLRLDAPGDAGGHAVPARSLRRPPGPYRLMLLAGRAGALGPSHPAIVRMMAHWASPIAAGISSGYSVSE